MKLVKESLYEYGGKQYDHRIGDYFPIRWAEYGYNLDADKPRGLFLYKGYHPNVGKVANNLTITGEDGNYWILNNGEYKIFKEDLINKPSQRHKQEAERIEKKEKERRDKKIKNIFKQI